MFDGVTRTADLPCMAAPWLTLAISIKSSTISGNTAAAVVAALCYDGDITIDNSTVLAMPTTNFHLAAV
jgi:hypothetical protein